LTEGHSARLGVDAGQARAAATAPDDVQFSVTATIPSGDVIDRPSVATVPAGKLLVITSVSYYRNGGAANSIGQMFLLTTVGGVTSTTALPEAKADGSLYPAATLATTLYADAGTTVIADCVTNTPQNSAENDYVSVTGYYVAKK
jgi:putative N-acetylmannosamine-6-phosphate epimerase